MIDRYDVHFEKTGDGDWIESHIKVGDGLFVFASDALLLEFRIEQLEVELKRHHSNMDITEVACGLSGIYSSMDKKIDELNKQNAELRKAILTIAALVDWAKDWKIPFSIEIDGSITK